MHSEEESRRKWANEESEGGDDGGNEQRTGTARTRRKGLAMLAKQPE